jgi:alpha-1,2-glucosyltransferase
LPHCSLLPPPSSLLPLTPAGFHSGLASAPFALEKLTVGLMGTLREAIAAGVKAPLAAGLGVLAVLACCRQTLGHAFLLADNRHVTFYLWRHVLGRRWYARYLLAPLHLLLGREVGPVLWRVQGPLISLGLGLCCALVLVPSPLIEPRYLTVPVLLLRLHLPPLKGPAAWLPPLVVFAAVNAAALAVFLRRPYVWGDGSEARLMW